MNDKRKFVQRLTSSGNVSQNQPAPVDVLMRNSELNVVHPVDPVDFETFLSKNKLLITNDPNRDLVIFPSDDVKTTRLPRQRRTVNSGVPSDAETAYANNQLARQCLDFYTGSWTTTEYRYGQYSGNFIQSPRKDADLRTVPPEQKFEVDEESEADDSSKTGGRSAGSYHEGKLAVCTKADHQAYLRNREEALRAGGSGSVSGVPPLRSFCLKQLADNTHVLEEVRRDCKQNTVYLDSAVSTRELGEVWIQLSMEDQPELMLYTGGKEENRDWVERLRSVIQLERDMRSGRTTGGGQMGDGDFADSVRGCLQRYSQETESTITHLRSKDRQKILSVYPEIRIPYDQKSRDRPEPEEGTPEDAGVDPFPSRPELSRRFKVTCRRLQTGLQANVEVENGGVRIDNPEPFFVSACLVHIGEGRRISEDFHWDPNTWDVSRMIPKELFKSRWARRSSSRSNSIILQGVHAKTTNGETHGPPTVTAQGLQSASEEALAKCKAFVFTSAYPDDQVWLLLRVDKVLSTSVGGAADKYIKSGGSLGMVGDNSGGLSGHITGADAKAAQAVHKVMSVYCRNIGHYRMPFAWGARPLSGRSHDVRLYKHDSNKLSEDDLIKHVQSLARSAERQVRWQMIPAILSINVEELTDDTHFNATPLSPSLVPAQTSSSTASPPSALDRTQPVVREVEDFLYDATRAAAAGMYPEKVGVGGTMGTTNAMTSKMAVSDADGVYNGGLGDAETVSMTSGVTGSGERGGTAGATGWGRDANGAPRVEALVTPHLDFVNNLYIYPKSLNFSGQNAFPRARNLSCFIELRDNDDVDMTSPLKVFYTHPGPHQSPFDIWANTSVTYHDTSPNFSEEVKICVPRDLNHRHHLLFRFYHVSVDTAGNANARERTSGKRHLETGVGYAWVTLLNKEGNLLSGQFNIPVSINLPPGYLGYGIQETPPITWVEGQKLLFSVAMRLKSSVYTLNSHLHRFFKCCERRLGQMQVQQVTASSGPAQSNDSKRTSLEDQPNNGLVPRGSGATVIEERPSGDVEVQNTLKALGALDLCTIIQFMAPLFNQLLQIVASVTSNPEVPKTTVCTMAILVSRVTGKGPDKFHRGCEELRKRNTKLLKSYVKYALDSERVAIYRSQPVHQTLVNNIFALMCPPVSDSLTCYRIISNNWFFLSVIAKSMVQYLCQTNKIKADRVSETRFPAQFQTQLTNMFSCLVDWIIDMSQPQKKCEMYEDAKEANIQLARFTARLLNFMDRGFVFRLIQAYMEKFQKKDKEMGEDRDRLMLMKCQYIEQICHHEHFLPLNLPSLSRNYHKDVRAEFFLTEKFCQQHYLVGLLLQMVHSQLSDPCPSSSSFIRRQPIVVLRNQLAKHSLDTRYLTKAAQARIASLYMPLMNMLLERKRLLCMPGSGYAATSRPRESQVVTNATGGGTTGRSRPMSLVSADTTSLGSAGSLSLSGATASLPGGGGSVYGAASTSTSIPRGFLTRDGKVEISVLDAIAGVGTGGSLQRLTGRRRGTDTSSIGSTSTLTAGGSLSEDLEEDLIDDVLAADEDEAEATTPTVEHPFRKKGKPDEDEWSESVLEAAKIIPRRFLPAGNTGSLGSGKRAAPPPIPLDLQKARTKRTVVQTSRQPVFLNDKCQRDLLVSMLHVLSAASEDCLSVWLRNITVHDRIEFLDVLELSIHHVKYLGKKRIQKFESISTGGISRQSAVGNMANLRAHARGSLAPQSSEDASSVVGDDPDQQGGTLRSLLEGNLSTEAALIILDVTALFCNVFRTEMVGYTGEHPIFRKLVDIYLSFLRTSQSETLLRHLFASMRVFINRFAKVLFAGCATVVGDICYEALRCLNSKLQSTRSEACGLLYILMKSSYEACGKAGFNRVHLQMIISVSKLVGTIEEGFATSLSTLNTLAQTDWHRSTSGSGPATGVFARRGHGHKAGVFIDEVSDLTRRIRTVLMATAQMREHAADPEMLVDLQYSLAKSYATNPALRRTWLEAIWKVHNEHKATSEMAMVKIHIAALMAEYLRRRGNYPQGCSSFSAVSPNIELEESGMREDSGQLEVHYTEEDLCDQLREAAEALDRAGLWEVMVHVYRLLIPVHERDRDFVRLSALYNHLAKGYERVIKEDMTGHRLFGEYYRVCFYGQAFDTLAGKIFIYKADNCLELSSMCNRLMTIFSTKYGADRVQLLTEAHVARSTLDSRKAYVQVTHVEPFCDGEEEADRQTKFEKNFNVKRFMFETPFIKQTGMNNDACLLSAGPKRTDDLSSQWKRRTILTSEQCFPNLKRRLEVVHVAEVDLSPIEGAVDAIRAKNRQLAAHVGLKTFSKLMDMHLQGALLTTVNQGPMAYAEVFLKKENQFAYPPAKVQILKNLFLEFLSTCLVLLKQYYELMMSELMEKYKAMRQALDTYRIELSNLVKEEIIVDEEKMIIATKSSIVFDNGHGIEGSTV